MKITKILACIVFIWCHNFHATAQEDSNDGINYDSINVHLINTGSYDKVTENEKSNVTLQIIASALLSNNLDSLKSQKIIQNIIDWNAGNQNYRLEVNNSILQILISEMDNRENIASVAQESKGDKQWLEKLLPILSLLGTLALFIILFDKIRNRKMDLTNEIEKLKNQIKGLMEKVESLETQVRENENSIKLVRQKYSEFESSNRNSNLGSESIKSSIVPNSKTTKSYQTYYAKNSKENRFISKFTKIENDGNLYFHLKLSNTEGTYSVVNDKAIQNLLVMNGYDGAKSSFEELNDRTNFKTIITNVSEGKLKKVENGWEIVEKLKIRYS